MGTAPYKVPVFYEQDTMKDIWEPPAPLAWIERHPHLFVILCAPFIMAACLAASWWLS